MKILALPRDPNPYQRLLYGEMAKLGADVRYLGLLTPSHTVNLLSLPLETVARRMTGADVVHLHWVFGFTLPGATRFPVLRRLAQAWFQVWLGTIRLLGMRLVWTAHNVLPHSQVFQDDAVSRRILVDHCDLVIAHSEAALAELAAMGAIPKRSVIIRHGPLGPTSPVALRVPGSENRSRQFLFFGKVAEYKGVEELLAAFAALPPQLGAKLIVAGQCVDQSLRERLVAPPGVQLRLEVIPEDEIAGLMDRADVVVLPVRRVTTSGSAELALAYGRPLILPNLQSLADLPDAAVVRYDGSVGGLTSALADLACAEQSRLAAMSTAALSYSEQVSWPEIAMTTLQAMTASVGEASGVVARSRSAIAP